MSSQSGAIDSVDALCHDLKRVITREGAAWIARSWVAWTPTEPIGRHPRVMLAESGPRGLEALRKIQVIAEVRRSNLAHRSILDGLDTHDTNEDVWEAARAACAAFVRRDELPEAAYVECLTPYMAGRVIWTYLTDQHPLVRDVAEGVLAGWTHEAGPPTVFISAVAELAQDLAGSE